MSLYRLSQLVRAGFRTVEFRCRRCPRAGRYRVAGLVEQWGAETTVAEVSDYLRRDCPYGRTASPDPYDICGIECPTLLELVGLRPRKG